jgi:hypothetical protein
LCIGGLQPLMPIVVTKSQGKDHWLSNLTYPCYEHEVKAATGCINVTFVLDGIVSMTCTRSVRNGMRKNVHSSSFASLDSIQENLWIKIDSTPTTVSVECCAYSAPSSFLKLWRNVICRISQRFPQLARYHCQQNVAFQKAYLYDTEMKSKTRRTCFYFPWRLIPGAGICPCTVAAINGALKGKVPFGLEIRFVTRYSITKILPAACSRSLCHRICHRNQGTSQSFSVSLFFVVMICCSILIT